MDLKIPMTDTSPLRLWEWGRADVSRLSVAARAEIEEAVEVWQLEAQLQHPPLRFEGARGEWLRARQYVGVVECGDLVIEIYPKLDRSVLQNGNDIRSDARSSVMAELLWVLDVSNFFSIAEADTADLELGASPFYDLFAYLLAANLLTELRNGVAHAYRPAEGDLGMVRGQIDLVQQITRNWNRIDRIACRWDEFTSDTPLNQILKCACTVLHARAGRHVVRRLLEECLALLDLVSDVPPQMALKEVAALRWSRTNDRFRRCYEMAIRVLAGCGYQLAHGSADTFVFLIDMNQVFEAFVGIALEERFGTIVACQESIGPLLVEPRGVSQRPDYLWKDAGVHWIGDAKYKMLGRNNVTVDDVDESAVESLEGVSPALRSVSAADLRQLTVYAEIVRGGQSAVPNLAVFYPSCGRGDEATSRARAWNGSDLLLVPVVMERQRGVGGALPTGLNVKSDAIPIEMT